ncbi:MAG: hypothetical protein AAF333_05445 [Planctomycetota bacterium]
MGWFLSNNSGGKAKKKKTSRGSKASGWDPERTLLGLKVLGGAALAVGLVLGWTASERVLGRYASEHRAVPITAESVELLDAPTWVDEPLKQHLQRRVAHSVTDNPLDRRGLHDAVTILDEEPWVAAVTQVRRGPNGRVKVLAEYRRPAALVASDHGYHLVDHQGVWLDGPVDRAASRWNKLPLITGVSAAPPMAGYGHVWEGADIPAALALEELLHREVYADQITAYDVSHRDLKGRLWLVLYTDGPAIIWGLPPGDERAVEPEAPVKLAALRDWAYKHGGRINVRGEADTVWVYTGTAQIDARPGTYSASRR